MSWISKIEEERRQQERAQREQEERQRKEKEATNAAFQMVKDRLNPILESTITELAHRTGIQLKMQVSNTRLIVAAPKDQRSFRVNPHHLIISNPNTDGTKVRVQAIEAGRTNRGGEPPEHMSAADYYGTDETILGTDVEVSDLVAGDLQILIEWLVRTGIDNKSPGTPQIKAVLQSKKQESRCFIATAVYGEANTAEINTLQVFRDKILLENSAGRLFVHVYYSISPTFAKLIAKSKFARKLVRAILLTPILLLIKPMIKGVNKT